MTWKTILENLTTHDRLGDALVLLDRVCKKTNDSYNGDTIISLRGQHARLKRDQTNQVISTENANISAARIRQSIRSVAGDLTDFEAPADWEPANSAPASAPGSGGKTSVSKDTILFLGANEGAAPDLDISKEFSLLAKKLEDKTDRFITKSQLNTHIDNLQEILLEKEPTILHVSSHGNPAGSDSPGGLVFEIEDVGLRDIAPQNFADLIGIVVADRPMRLLVLNACYGYDTAKLCSAHVTYAVGMRDRILDTAALKFTTALYLGLAKGYEVPRAFSLAVNKLKLIGVQEAMLPTLFADGAEVRH